MNVQTVTRLLALIIATGACSVPGHGQGVTSTGSAVAFRDLNHNGVLDPYEDRRLSPEVRTRDLLSRMTLEEKAGAMVHGATRIQPRSDGRGNQYDLPANEQLILRDHVTTMIGRLQSTAADLAEESNKLQAIAERGRLGIPVTISSDPRNHFQVVEGASVYSSDFSKWPETLGFAAIGDADLVKRFADIARQEYRAVGIHMALSPQADLATEPRWARINGTFGEDADMASRMVAAYVQGFQNSSSGIGKDGVQTVVKHWVGYGAAKDGFDSHNYYGRFSVVSASSLSYHVKPFEAAFRSGASGVMSTYSVLGNLQVNGQPAEQVGSSYSRGVLTDLLRDRYGFRGLVLSDFRVTADCDRICIEGIQPGEPRPAGGGSTPWGVENLSKAQRFVKGVQAGLDQFGGTEEWQYIADAVRAGQLSESRIDESVYRIMLQKMQLGLFDQPYVDPARAAQIVADPAHHALARQTQGRSLVVLENKDSQLPLRATTRKLFLSGIDAEVAKQRGYVVVSDPAQADLAIIHTRAPYQTLHPNFMTGSRQHEGDLNFTEANADYQLIRKVSAAVPTIVSVYLDRPAILTNLKDKVSVLLADFGVSDAALFDVLTGIVKPAGRLPFELPSSMEDVKAQASDLPHDTRQPLYHFGYGLTAKQDIRH